MKPEVQDYPKMVGEEEISGETALLRLNNAEEFVQAMKNVLTSGEA